MGRRAIPGTASWDTYYSRAGEETKSNTGVQAQNCGNALVLFANQNLSIRSIGQALEKIANKPVS